MLARLSSQRFTLGLLIATAVALFVTANRASAAGTPITICNQTSSAISVAASYRSSGPNDTATTLSGPIVSVGLWGIPPSQCATIANPFAARYVYWWGYVGGPGGSPLWGENGGPHFCVPDIYGPTAVPQFTLESENESEAACVAASYDSNGPNIWVPAREIDVDVDATVNFSGQ